MRRLFLIVGLAFGASFFMPVKLLSQSSCTNIDFSMGNFTNWQAYMGTWTTCPQPCHPTAGRHTIMDAVVLTQLGQLQDEICSAIPKVPSGFRYSARLGNTSTNSELEALEYTLTVDSSNALLTVHFAWVLQNPGHDINDQPRFIMQLRDTLNRVISACPPPIVFDPPMPTGVVCSPDPNARTWTTEVYDLAAYIGQTVKAYFETRDCSQGTIPVAAPLPL